MGHACTVPDGVGRIPVHRARREDVQDQEGADQESTVDRPRVVAHDAVDLEPPSAAGEGLAGSFDQDRPRQDSVRQIGLVHASADMAVALAERAFGYTQRWALLHP